MSKIFSIEIDDENSLVEELRGLCNKDGSEKEENLKETAKIFHKLGCIYANKAMVEKNQKICFIQSTVLLNAALSKSRDPENVNFLSDLNTVCSKILELAGAKKQSHEVNLVKVSNLVSQEISDMREYTKNQLDSIPAIPDVTGEELKRLKEQKVKQVQQTQEGVSQKFQEIMKIVANHCVNVLGKPKCGYALTAMGSLARREVTPYSDFENVILLPDLDHKQEVFEYFRWFAVIFQIILINLKETIIPSVCIPTLNNFIDPNRPEQNWFYDKFTTRGISFDGLMPYASKCPLGRPFQTEKCDFTTELIQPVSKMVKFLELDTAIKEGYHLADVLSTTAFVCGDESIYESFSQKSQGMLDQQRQLTSWINQLADQVEEDRRSFEIWNSLASLHNKASSNMKRIVYRSTTIFISSLGKFYGLDVFSGFKIIEDLQKKDIFTIADAEELSFAVALACEIRLRMYMSRGGQSDDLMKTVSGEKYVSELYKLVGERSTLEYYHITYALHEALPDFRDKERPQRLPLRKALFVIPAIHYFLHEYEKSVESFRSDLELSDQSNDLKVYAWFRIGHAFLKREKFQEARCEFERVIDLLSRTPEVTDRDFYYRRSLVAVGDCYRNVKDYEEALSCYQKAPISNDDLTELNNLAVVHLRLKHYAEAKSTFELAVALVKKSKRPDKDWLAFLTHNVGRCHYEQGEFHTALEKMLDSLDLRMELFYGKPDSSFAHNLYNIGRCYLQLHRLDEAVENIKKALKMHEELPDTISRNTAIADCLHHLGLSEIEQQQYASALRHFEQERDRRQKVGTSSQVSVEKEMEKCLGCIKDCTSRLQ